MASLTLLEIAKKNGSDKVVGLIEEVVNVFPELQIGAARTIKGQNYKTLVRTGLPTVGFRNANEGVASTVSTYENRLVETFILNTKWNCDKAVADSNEDGPENSMFMEGVGQLQAAFRTVAKQFYYGRTTGDAKGHPGLIDSIASAMTVDATGSTADTGSSVWLVKFGMQDVQWVWGENGSLDLSDIRIGDITQGSGTYTAYIQEILSYVGVQVGSTNSIARIKNLTAQAGKGLTDSLIFDALETFPSGVRPDAIFMSRRSRGQLRKSRTATNATGAPAPIPTEVDGIPVYATDAILNTEAIA